MSYGSDCFTGIVVWTRTKINMDQTFCNYNVGILIADVLMVTLWIGVVVWFIEDDGTHNVHYNPTD